ncbi:MAG: hypothetical protein AB7F86_00485 [Bdellovibrionales bacterium]
MNKPLRFASLSLLLALILFQFNNCGKYAEPMAGSGTATLTSCTTPKCISPSVDNLSLKVNLGGQTEYQPGAAAIDFNLGGDCNEGGYPFNTIRWELYLNNVKVRDSGMLGMAGNAPVHSRCVNGRFLLYVNLNAIPEDNVSRVGLSNGTGGTAPYDLYVEVYGQEVQNGPAQRNLLKARTRIVLKP